MDINKHGCIGVMELDSGKFEVSYHAAGDPGGSYDTLCGISLSDDLFELVVVPDSIRISCSDCKQVWRLARSFKASNFTKD